jgi:CRP/FNR family cyclic AMP-dependent transcriptional regulator
MAGAPTDLLERVPLFSDLEHKELEQIAGSMKQRTFTPGETVVAEGDQGVGFFVIENGIATVSVGGDDVRTLKPGDHFGEIALLAGGDRTSTITADSELTCWGLTSWAFRPLVEENASIAWKLLQAMAKMLSR